MVTDGSLNRLLVLSLFFIILLNPTNTFAEEVDYTRYANNASEFCHGIHVGDKFIYEILTFSQTVWENNSITSSNSDSEWNPFQINLEVTDIRANTATSLDSSGLWARYRVNWTSSRPIDPITHEVLSSLAGVLRPTAEDYFIFTDWDAWINSYGNLSLKEINKYPFEGQSYDSYVAWIDEDYFIRHIMILLLSKNKYA